MDFTDFERCKKEAHVFNRTPYDVLSWQTLKTYGDYGFLTPYAPPEGTSHDSSKKPLCYNNWISQNDKDTFRSIAKKITNSLSKEQLQMIVSDGYKGWQKFGLEMRKHFKGKDPLFTKAIEKTDEGISQIEKGLIPVDPERLLHRYLMKLLTGLHIGKKYAARMRISEGNIMVFETPEYSYASGLLINELNLGPNTFAIPKNAPEKNELLIKDILNLNDSSLPLLSSEISLLFKAIECIKDQLDTYSIEEISRDINAKVEDARRKVSKRDVIAALSLAGTNVPVWAEVGKALLGKPTNSLTPVIVSLLSLIVAICAREKILKDVLNEYTEPVKFIVGREITYNFNPAYNIKKIWLDYLLSLARFFKPKPLTIERISRQMMEPWIENPVWYDHD